MMQNADLRSRAIAVAAILAMLVAPLCAPLCRSGACAPASAAQSEDCHNSVAASDDAPPTGIAAIRVCGLQELPTAALNEKANSIAPVKQVCAPLHFFSPMQTEVTLTNGAHDTRPDSEPGTASSSFQASVLRI